MIEKRKPKIGLLGIMHGLYDVAGRCGLGAVMGSKNLKAVAVREHKLPAIADRECIKEIRQQMILNLKRFWKK